MQFSVVIPTYNRAELIGATLRSVYSQSCSDFEVIVVNDGSTDNTLDVLAEFGHSVRVLSSTNKGPSAARNIGVSAAQGEYVAFLDSDDLWFPWTLEIYREALRQHGPTAMLRACSVEFNSEAAVASVSPVPFTATRRSDYFEAGWLDEVYIGAGLIAVRRADFLQVGGFDERLHCAEDHDFALRMGRMPGFVTVRSPLQIAYRRHAASATQDLGKTADAFRIIMHREKAGAYPGGKDRQKHRRKIIARAARPVIIECLRVRRWRDAWILFAGMLPWNIGQRRWRFLLAFPLLALRHWLIPGADNSSR